MIGVVSGSFLIADYRSINIFLISNLSFGHLVPKKKNIFDLNPGTTTFEESLSNWIVFLTFLGDHIYSYTEGRLLDTRVDYTS